MKKTQTYLFNIKRLIGFGFLFFALMVALPCLPAQKTIALLKTLETANSPKEQIDLMVKIADGYADRKDFYKALEYRARAVKLNELEKIYRYDDSLLTKNLGEKICNVYALDSLKLVLQNLTSNLQTPAFYNLIASQVTEYYSSEYTIELSEKALQLSRSSKNKLQEAVAHYNIGRILFNLSIHDQADSNLMEALRYFQVLKDTVEIVKTCILLGRNNLWLYRLNRAEQYLLEALPLAIAIDKTELILGCLFELRDVHDWRGNYGEVRKLNEKIGGLLKIVTVDREIWLEDEMWAQGSINRTKGNYRAALPFILEVLRICEEARDTFYITNASYMLGEIYMGLCVYDTSLLHYQKALQLATLKKNNNYAVETSLTGIYSLLYEIGDKEGAMEYAKKMEGHLASIEREKDDNPFSSNLKWKITFFEKLGQLDSAIYYAEKFVSFAKQSGATSHLIEGLIKTGSFLQKKGSPDHAIAYLRQALEKATALGLDSKACEALLHLSEIAAEKGDFKQAIKNASQGLELAEKLELTSFLPDIYQSLSQSYSETGDFKMAYQFQVKLDHLEDSLFGFTQQQQLSKFESQFRLKEKDLENQRLQIEKAEKEKIIRQRTSQIMVLSVIILLITLSAYLFSGQAKLRAENKLRKAITRDIHDDVGSTLNDLKMTIKEAIEDKAAGGGAVEGKLNRAVQLGNQAMDSLKNLIWSLDKPQATLESFTEEVKSLTHETLAAHKIPFQFDIVGFERHLSLAPKVYHNLLMIYKEALQNAVKHGDHKQIATRLVLEGNKFLLSVKNGIASAPRTLPGSGMGLRNMKERAAALGGDFATVKTEGFFEVCLTIEKLF
jgi:signal transduction histidine kinase